MARTATKSDPKLWDKVKTEVTEGDKGGRPGQWSARKAQMASAEYKKRGGGYEGEKPKAEDNSLREWTKEDWGTKSGEKSNETGERYLPRKAREELSDQEYQRTTEKKRADTKQGKQFSQQPADVAKKSAKHRDTDTSGGGRSRAALMAEAKQRDIPGRSKMKKDELQRALGG